jgi:exopolyphosphatase/guanosine-5'-triphosphate,3'-diphosphate pyrophosphatase
MFRSVVLPGTPQIVVGVAGTFRSLAAVHLALGYYDRNMTHGVFLSQDDLEGLVDRFAKLTVDETAAIPSLAPQRAPVILAGAIVAAEASRVADAGGVTVSKTGILQGIVLDLARSSGRAPAKSARSS